MSVPPAKPGLRLSVSHWHGNNQQLSAAAEHERHLSNEVRQEGRTLRSETTIKTIWDERQNGRRLSDRIWDVARCKETLEMCAQEVDKEMEALTLSKEQVEQALVATVTPLEVSVECLTLRDGRCGAELVSDPVEEQLRREVELIQSSQQVLQQHVDKAFEQLCVLQELRHQLTMDLQNKMDALQIDTTCLSLTVESPLISMKSDPARIPSGSVTPQQWAQFSQSNVARAREAVHASRQMREDMSLTRAQLQNDLENHRSATEFALRKRTHAEEQAHHELEWQIKITGDEISDMEGDIRGLDQDLRGKTASLKLAHTRLESRTARPGADLCRDEVQRGLVDEVNQLQATIKALTDKLSEAQHSLQKLQLHRARMSQDLSRKQEALSLEQRTSATRGCLAAASSARNRPALVRLVNSSGRSNLKLLA